ncbi:MAG: acyl-CoA dehydrogenase [Actinomycetia bacterium]|nr:acyl-CoA dehydrogenase [Actinomycetes bacterium]
MHLQYGEAEEAFRAELVAWLEEHAPSRDLLREPRLSSANLTDWGRAWQRTLFDAGWLVPGWPPELGGRNATAQEQMIYFEELSKRQIPRSLNPQGLGIIAPSIKDYGTPEQREKFLLPTLRAEIAWSLGMSEPGAGSDLASLKTRAVLDGDEFVINGQKVWTSGAHHSDWCLCFVRTDTEVPKHKGITAIIVDMKTPGVEARPFAELTEPDYMDFNEVFFTDAHVPKENLLGEINGGWPITQGSLAHERAMLWIDYAYSLARAVDSLKVLGKEPGADGRPLRDDPKFRDEVAGFAVDAQAIMLMGYRGFSKFMAGKSSPEHSLLKLYGSEALQKALQAGAEWQGPNAIDMDVAGPQMWREGSWIIQWMRSFSGTIPGGTSEIQRNIIAERVLGLPRK